MKILTMFMLCISVGFSTTIKDIDDSLANDELAFCTVHPKYCDTTYPDQGESVERPI